MAAPANVVCVSAENSMKIKKIKCKTGQTISKGAVVCLYTTDGSAIQKLKAGHGGVIKEICTVEGDDINAGSPLYKVEECSHPTVMKDMCADCGSDLRLKNATAGKRKEQVSASVAMVHSIPELIVSEELAQELGKADENRLLKTRKLVLLVDLDQTLIHTTNDNIPANLKDVHHFQLWHGNQLLWYHTRLRPYTKTFLESIAKLYELHICTFGSRIYAHTIAKILDPEGKYFSHRILSRDECFNNSTKTANLKALFPCGESMVTIIDDREDVWNFSPNLIHVKPYRFFQGTADINAPPGLTKSEQDKDPISHRVRRISQSSTNSTDNQEVDKNENTQFPTEEEIKAAEKIRLKSITENEMDVDENDTESDEDQDSPNKTGTLGGGDSNETDKNNGVMEGKNVENHDNSESNDSGNSKEEEKENIPNQDKESERNQDVHNLKEGEEKSKVDSSADKQTENKNETDEKKDSEEKKDEPEVKMNHREEKTDAEKKDETENKKGDSEYKKGDSEEKKDDSEEKKDEEEMIVWEDEDDYLFYLKEILENIHSTFYDMIDAAKEKNEQPTESDQPNLKNIIPYMKKKVLKSCNLLFSGVIPTNMPQEKSRAYIVAKALGANIHSELVTKHNEKDPTKFTTHLVAARSGTSKVRSALKHKRVCIVTAEWLWSCAERWEKVEESLFPLTKTSGERSCDSPAPDMVKKRDGKRKLPADDAAADRSDKRAKTEAEEKDFAHSYNPLYAFSDDDLEYMGKEVDDEMDSDDDESSEEDEERDQRLRTKVLKHMELEEDSSSQDSLSGNRPRGWGLGKLSPKSTSSSSSSESPKKGKVIQDELGPEYESETDQDKFDKIMDAFGPVVETSEDEDYQESIGSVDDEIADAVEKEFLSSM